MLCYNRKKVEMYTPAYHIFNIMWFRMPILIQESSFQDFDLDSNNISARFRHAE